MGNQNNQDNTEHTSFYDQVDGKINKELQNGKLSKGVVADDEKSEFRKNLMSDADAEVRANEDASLQDDSYSFDEANTDNEEYHDADEIDYDNDDDFIQ